MQSRAHCLTQIRPTPICSPLKSAHLLLTLPRKTFVRLKARFIPVKELHPRRRSSFFSACSSFCLRASSPAAAAGKKGQVWAAFALLHFNDRLHCCRRRREKPPPPPLPPPPPPPRLGKCKRMLHGCKRTKRLRYTHTRP